jgi:ABC-2 type transport system permease protein
MPIRPFEIALAKVWANGLIITGAVGLSLTIVVRLLLGIPVAGSIPLFLCGTAIFLFFTTSIGLFLGTVVRSMAQLGLLFILIAIPMMLLSGANTPLESMPPLLRVVMEMVPSTHFVSFAQAILYRGAGFDIVWPEFLAIAAFGALFLGLAVLRFRKVAAQAI